MSCSGARAEDRRVDLVGGRPGLRLGLRAQVRRRRRARAGSCLVPSGVDGVHGDLELRDGRPRP